MHGTSYHERERAREEDSDHDSGSSEDRASEDAWTARDDVARRSQQERMAREAKSQEQETLITLALVVGSRHHLNIECNEKVDV